MSNRVGTILGIALGAVLVGGLAGTPYYLQYFQSDDRAVAAQITEDVETLRRAVFNLDPFTALVADIDKSPAAGAAITDDEIKDLAARPPEELFSREMMRELNRSEADLTAVEGRDTQRGIRVIGKGTILRRQLRVKYVVDEMRRAYLKERDHLLATADKALADIRTTAQGGVSGANHLWTARLRAMIQLAKGRLHLNYAQFEYEQADGIAASAGENAVAIKELTAQLERLDAYSTADQSAAVDATLKQVQLGIAAAKQGVAQLQKVLAAQKAQADLLRKSIASLVERQHGVALDSATYADLAARQRRAEAALAAIEQGTLDGAKQLPDESAEISPPRYEGGTPIPSLDTLHFRLKQAQAQLASLANMADGLEKQRARIEEAAGKVADEKSAVQEKTDAQKQSFDELTQRADAHRAAAAAAEEKALSALKDAARAAKDAIAAAKKIAADARQAGPADERLQMVSQDTGAELSMHFLAGEIAYTTALAKYGHIEAARSAAALRASVETAAQDNPEEIDALQKDALDQLVLALKEFDQTSTLLSRTSIRSDSGASVSGKNLVWQVQIAEAAVHLLHADLVSDDEDASFAEKTAAYDALKLAVENREQSPLLSTAVNSLIYLQQSVR